MPSPDFYRGPALGVVDPSSLAGAQAMAETIRNAWRRVGVDIAVDIDSFGSGTGIIYGARIVEPVRAGV